MHGVLRRVARQPALASHSRGSGRFCLWQLGNRLRHDRAKRITCGSRPFRGEEAGEMKKTFKANAQAKAAAKPATKTVAKRSAVSVTKAGTKKAKTGTKTGADRAALPSKASKKKSATSAPARSTTATTATKTKVTPIAAKRGLTKTGRAADPREIHTGRSVAPRKVQAGSGADPREIHTGRSAVQRGIKTGRAAVSRDITPAKKSAASKLTKTATAKRGAGTQTAAKTQSSARSGLARSVAAESQLKRSKAQAQTQASPTKRGASSASPVSRNKTLGRDAAKQAVPKRKSSADRRAKDDAQLQLGLVLDQTPATGTKPDKPTFTRYALLLRGVNVGGPTNVLPMVELRDMLDEIGCTHVQTYVQSGNAVFGCSHAPEEITREIERLLEQYMGRHIDTTLRTAAQLKSIVEANPFKDVATDPQFLTVTFLTSLPTEQELAPLYEKSFEPELFKVMGQEIFMWQPNGQARSNLAIALGRLPLRGTYTTRNWSTVTKLCELLEST